jgi:hypothetical protein
MIALSGMLRGVAVVPSGFSVEDGVGGGVPDTWTQ